MAMKELGDLVRSAQGQMTGRKLSQLSGVDESKISNLRNGTLKETLPVHELEGLSAVLGIPQFRMLQALGYDVGAPEPSGEQPTDPIRDAVIAVIDAHPAPLTMGLVAVLREVLRFRVEP